MSTVAEGRRWEDRPWSVERLLAWRPRITVEVVAWGLILALALVLRFWDLGGRAMHHDESLHGTFSWYFYKGRGYTHDPLMHGPLLFHLMALGYLLFGVSEATARFVPAFFGAAMVALPLLLRPWLGRVGALAAAALIAVSPTLLYVSRFVGAGAQDILVSVGVLMVVAGIWHYERTGLPKWIYVIAAGLAIGFTTKEVTYMFAALFVLYLNGAVAARLAEQTAADRGWPARQRRLATVLLMPFAWAIALCWPALGRPAAPVESEPAEAALDDTEAVASEPVEEAEPAPPARSPWYALGRLRERMGWAELPRLAGPMIVIGTLSAPFFCAAIEVPLRHFGVVFEPTEKMLRENPNAVYDSASWVTVDGKNWSNDLFFGAIAAVWLAVFSVWFGTIWRKNEWLIAAAIFWGITLPLYATFGTNFEGIGTGVWGSLDYWLNQQGEVRGNQPEFYYLILTPVYEYLALGLAFALLVWRAARTGKDTALAAAAAAVVFIVGAIVGDAGLVTAPFVLAGFLLCVYAMRGHPFQQFLVFWFGAILLGLSAAGEKMPWLEAHIALPLALIAAAALNEVAESVRGRAWPAWARPAVALAALGVACAVLALLTDTFSWANPALAVALLAGVLTSAALAVRRHPGAAAAATAFFLGVAGPLSVRAAGVAAYENNDVAVEMLVYTQSSPALDRIAKQIDQYARDSGLGYDLPITVDSSDAFAWPWSWYLRDYRQVQYIDFGSQAGNANFAGTLRPGGVVLAAKPYAGVGAQRPDILGPGIEYEHRWWFPEGFEPVPETGFAGSGYRSLTTANLWRWLRDPAYWKAWGGYFLHRDPGERLGSVNAVAYFPIDADAGQNLAQAPAPEPKTLADGRIVSGAPGFGRGQFQRPAGLAVDAEGNVYVADSLNNRVQKLGPDGRSLAVLTSRQPLREPWSVAVDRDGNLYVADTWNHRIQKFDRDLNFVAMWGSPAAQLGGANPGPLQLYGPRAIAIDAQGNLLVTDTGNHRVLKFSPTGQPLGSFGANGSGQGQFQEPVGIAIAATGDILVADTWNGRIQRFGADFAYKGEFAVSGWEDHGVENKPYITAAPDGAIYVAVPDEGSVRRYSAEGRLEATVLTLAAGAGGARPRALGVAVTTTGDLWVTDAAGSQVIRTKR